MPRGIAKDHDAKRTALRKGAARYFARHGYDRASMTGTARECGVSKALIYHYYDSKEALLHDILNAHLSDLVGVATQTSTQGLNSLIHAILDTYADADAEHKLQLDALHTLPAPLRQPLIDLQKDLIGTMSDVLTQHRPDLTADQLRALTMSIFGILNWFFMWHRPGKGLDREAYADLIASFVAAGLKSTDLAAFT